MQVLLEEDNDISAAEQQAIFNVVIETKYEKLEDDFMKEEQIEDAKELDEAIEDKYKDVKVSSNQI